MGTTVNICSSIESDACKYNHRTILDVKESHELMQWNLCVFVIVTIFILNESKKDHDCV